MKHLKQWTAALLTLMMALMTALAPAAAFTEALPAEEPAELFGDPWVNSMVTGNLPAAAPEMKDDFYTAVNYDVLAANQEGMYYPMMYSAAESQAAVTALLQDEALTGSGFDQLKIFMEQAADLDTLRETACSEISPYLDRIGAAASIEELNAVLTAADFPFSPYLAMPVAPPALNEENGVWIYPALSLSSDYLNGANNYTDTVEDLNSLLSLANAMGTAPYITPAMEILGIEAGDTAGTLVNLFNMEVGYVKKGYSETEAARADYGYISAAPHRMTAEELDSLCSRFPVTATLKKFGKDGAASFVVPYPAWLEELDSLWTEENLDRIKLLTRFKVLMEAFPFLDPSLSDDMRNSLGQPSMDAATNAWSVCNRANTFSQLLAQLYAEKVLGSELKEKLVKITRELTGAYRSLLTETEWISEEGRTKAMEKLDYMRLNILEPDGGYYDFSGLELIPSSEGGTLFTNYLAVRAYLNEQENGMIGRPARADLCWKALSPLTANCFYDPFSNSVNILPGFLFSFICPDGSSEAEMLGGIGTIIAHEMSHAFDFAGSQCDAYGRGNAILSETDRETFLEKVKAVEDYYNAITVLPGLNCRGTFLRVENTADLAGLKAAAALAKARGLDMEAFFREYARIYTMAIPEWFQQTLYSMDTHAPGYLRVNVNLQMTDEFHEAFDVKEGDGMYVRPEDRLKIWGK